MKPIKALAALVVMAGLGACTTVDTATRNTVIGPAGVSAATTGTVELAAPARTLVSAYNVQSVVVNVPRTLKVSEANRFYPVADIVWRGDPRGDRYQQVEAIFQASMDAGVASMKSGPAAIVEVEVERFHCLTEKARLFTGGVYSINFKLTVRDAATGALLEAPRSIKADLKASGGDAAMAEDARGFTQKVAITQHLTRVIQFELSRPAGSVPAEQPVSRLDSGTLRLTPAPI